MNTELKGKHIDALQRKGIVKPPYEYEKAHTYPVSRPFWSILDINKFYKSSYNKRKNKPYWIYFHVPFCKADCSFCFYYRCKLQDSIVDEYVECIKEEIAFYLAWYNDESENFSLNNSSFKKKVKEYLNEIEKNTLSEERKIPIWQLYIGGGTPNSLSDTKLEELLQIISRCFIIEESSVKKYIGTIEVSPESLTNKQLEILKNSTLNVQGRDTKRLISRISLGLQTLRDNKLKQYLRVRNWEESEFYTSEIIESNLEPIEEIIDNSDFFREKNHVDSILREAERAKVIDFFSQIRIEEKEEILRLIEDDVKNYPTKIYLNSNSQEQIKKIFRKRSILKIATPIITISNIISKIKSDFIINIDLIYGLPTKFNNFNFHNGEIINIEDVGKDRVDNLRAELKLLFLFLAEKKLPNSFTLYYLRNVPWTKFSTQSEFLKFQLSWRELIEFRTAYYKFFTDRRNTHGGKYKLDRPHCAVLVNGEVNEYPGAPTLDRNNYGYQLGFGPSAYSHIGYQIGQNMYPFNKWKSQIKNNTSAIAEGTFLKKEHRITRYLIKSLVRTEEKTNIEYFEDDTQDRKPYNIFNDFSDKLICLNRIPYFSDFYKLTKHLSLINFYNKDEVLLNVLKLDNNNRLYIDSVFDENGNELSSVDNVKRKSIIKDIENYNSFFDEQLKIEFIHPNILASKIQFLKLNDYGKLIDEEIIYFLYPMENISVASLEINKRIQRIFDDSIIKAESTNYLSDILEIIERNYIPFDSENVPDYIGFWQLIKDIKGKSVIQNIKTKLSNNSSEFEIKEYLLQFASKIVKDNFFNHDEQLSKTNRKIFDDKKDEKFNQRKIKFMFESNLGTILPSLKKDHFGFSLDFFNSSIHFGSFSIHHASDVSYTIHKETYKSSNFDEFSKFAVINNGNDKSIIEKTYDWIKDLDTSFKCLHNNERVKSEFKDHTENSRNSNRESKYALFKAKVLSPFVYRLGSLVDNEIQKISEKDYSDPYIFQGLIANILKNSPKKFLVNKNIKSPFVFVLSNIHNERPSVSIPRLVNEDATHIFEFRGDFYSLFIAFLEETKMLPSPKEINDFFNNPDEYLETKSEFDIFQHENARDYKRFLDDFRVKLELMELLFPFIYFGQPLFFSCKNESNSNNVISLSLSINPLFRLTRIKEISDSNEQEKYIDKLINYSSLISSGLLSFAHRFNEFIDFLTPIEYHRNTRISSDIFHSKLLANNLRLIAHPELKNENNSEEVTIFLGYSLMHGNLATALKELIQNSKKPPGFKVIPWELHTKSADEISQRLEEQTNIDFAIFIISGAHSDKTEDSFIRPSILYEIGYMHSYLKNRVHLIYFNKEDLPIYMLTENQSNKLNGSENYINKNVDALKNDSDLNRIWTENIRSSITRLLGYNH